MPYVYIVFVLIIKSSIDSKSNSIYYKSNVYKFILLHIHKNSLVRRYVYLHTWIKANFFLQIENFK